MKGRMTVKKLIAALLALALITVMPAMGEDNAPELNAGVDITLAAFAKGLPFGGRIAEIVLMVSLVFFAYTTTLGWTFYSEKCLEYLVGVRRRFRRHG